MRSLHFKHCVKLLDLEHSGYRSDRKALAKAVGVKIRSIDRYHAEIRRARELFAQHPPLQSGEGRGEGVCPEEDGDAPPRFANKALLRLARIDQLLQLEYSGYDSTVHELAANLRVDPRTLYRDLQVIEEVRGAPVRMAPRRKKGTK